MRGRFELRLPVIDLTIGTATVTVILDTGFNGELLLPEGIIAQLGLKFVGHINYVAVDGPPRQASAYLGEIVLNNRLRQIEVIGSESNFALAGMALFEDSEITLNPREGLVLIEA